MTHRVLAACGIVGPVVYAIVLAVLGSLWPGYSHATQSMSELGSTGAPHAIVMNTAGFPLLGVLLMAFAWGLYQDLKNSKSAKIGCALIALSGFSLVMTGVFRCDAGCIDVTSIGTTHSVFATISSFAMMFAPFALLPALGNDDRWRNYALLSLTIGLVAAVLSALYGFQTFQGWEGAMQRVSMGVSLLWVEVMAIKLARLS